MIPVALTIAGSDPSGGAGLQADLKTFHQHRVYGMSVVTLLTVQNTQSVTAVETVSPEFITAQLAAVIDDIPPLAAKTGALGNAAIIDAVATQAERFSFPLVVDPVMVSKHGSPLIDADAVDTLIARLLPSAFLITPNLPEASRLVGFEVTDRGTMKAAAIAIRQLGVRHVLIKGGHLEGTAVDVLYADEQVVELPAERIETHHTHGTGCVYSAAITARLAGGEDVVKAVQGAKQFITAAIRTNPGLGHGYGPVNLHAATG